MKQVSTVLMGAMGRMDLTGVTVNLARSAHQAKSAKKANAVPKDESAMPVMRVTVAHMVSMENPVQMDQPEMSVIRVKMAIEAYKA